MYYYELKVYLIHVAVGAAVVVAVAVVAIGVFVDSQSVLLEKLLQIVMYW